LIIRIPKFKRGDVVEIHWKDHWGSAGWRSLEATEATLINVSILFYHSIKDGYLLGYQTYDPEGIVTGAHGIIINNITKIRRLK
jgi:hypothetical protein